MPGTLPICNVFINEEKSSQVELNTNTEPPRIRHSINCFGTFRSFFFFFLFKRIFILLTKCPLISVCVNVEHLVLLASCAIKTKRYLLDPR